MWLSKPFYEALPFYYMAIGLGALAASVYVERWYWPLICGALGVSGLIAGLVLWLKRRDYRASRSRRQFEETR